MPARAGVADGGIPIGQLLLLAGRQHGRLQLVDQPPDLVDAHRQVHIRRGEGELGQKVQPFDQQHRATVVQQPGEHVAEGFITRRALDDFVVDDAPVRLADHGGVGVEVERGVELLEAVPQEDGGHLGVGGAGEQPVEHGILGVGCGGEACACRAWCHRSLPDLCDVESRSETLGESMLGRHKTGKVVTMYSALGSCKTRGEGACSRLSAERSQSSQPHCPDLIRVQARVRARSASRGNGCKV
ncbi:hypothetical protein D3C76_1202910 [compost metagenome]